MLGVRKKNKMVARGIKYGLMTRILFKALKRENFSSKMRRRNKSSDMLRFTIYRCHTDVQARIATIRHQILTVQ